MNDMTTTTETTTPVLDASGVTMRFGGLTAVRNVDLTVNAGEIVGLIGPNGAGKTTFFNCLTGLYVPTEGKVRYKGTVLPPKPHLVTQAGIARTFQNIRLFANMTVLENVLVGRHTRTKEGLWSALLRGPGFKKAEAASHARAMELLEFIGLQDKADHLARNLPYGDQRKLEIARALASDPGLLLLDEPTMRHEPAGNPRHRTTHLRHPGHGHRRTRHRARHALHLQPLRPRRLPSPGRKTRRRHTRSRPGRRTRRRRLPRHALRRRHPREGRRTRGRIRHSGQRGKHHQHRRGRPVTALLEVEDLRVAYGKIEAVKGISFTVEAYQVVTLIGTNGAGKTTTLRTLSGLLKPSGGRILFDGKPLTGIPAHKIVALGLAHSPEGRHIFPRLSIAENLQLGAFLRTDKAGIEKDIQRAYDLFPILGERRKQAAGTLSGGEQQMLAMGRALMSQPKLLMLDEPSMGLSPIMMQKIMETIVELKASGTTILLVEQNAQAALSLADQGHVMEVGKVVLSGTGADLLHDESVRKAYLGED